MNGIKFSNMVSWLWSVVERKGGDGIDIIVHVYRMISL